MAIERMRSRKHGEVRRRCYKSSAIPIMPKHKLAIFDFDGTLSDSFPWFLRVVNSIADKHRFRRIEADDVEMLRGKSSGISRCRCGEYPSLLRICAG
jgi:hypothetical protein